MCLHVRSWEWTWGERSLGRPHVNLKSKRTPNDILEDPPVINPGSRQPHNHTRSQIASHYFSRTNSELIRQERATQEEGKLPNDSTTSFLLLLQQYFFSRIQIPSSVVNIRGVGLTFCGVESRPSPAVSLLVWFCSCAGTSSCDFSSQKRSPWSSVL